MFRRFIGSELIFCFILLRIYSTLENFAPCRSRKMQTRQLLWASLGFNTYLLKGGWIWDLFSTYSVSKLMHCFCSMVLHSCTSLLSETVEKSGNEVRNESAARLCYTKIHQDPYLARSISRTENAARLMKCGERHCCTFGWLALAEQLRCDYTVLLACACSHFYSDVWVAQLCCNPATGLVAASRWVCIFQWSSDTSRVHNVDSWDWWCRDKRKELIEKGCRVNLFSLLLDVAELQRAEFNKVASHSSQAMNSSEPFHFTKKLSPSGICRDSIVRYWNLQRTLSRPLSTKWRSSITIVKL